MVAALVALGVPACDPPPSAGSAPLARAARAEAANDVPSEVGAEVGAELGADVASVAPDVAQEVAPTLPEVPPTDAPDVRAGTHELRVDAPSHPTPSDAPHALLHVPEDATNTTVVFLHGWNGCVRVLAYGGQPRCARGHRPVEGWNLLAQLGSTPARVLIPQLAFRTRDGAPGRFREPTFAPAYLRELGLGEGPLVLVAHSAGFETALAWLRSEVASRVRAVVLFDALYAGSHAFADWARGAPDRRLVTYVVGSGRTRREHERLETYLRGHAIHIGHALEEDAPVRILEGRAAHGDLPARHLREVLDALVERERISAGSRGRPRPSSRPGDARAPHDVGAGARPRRAP